MDDLVADKRQWARLTLGLAVLFVILTFILPSFLEYSVQAWFAAFLLPALVTGSAFYANVLPGAYMIIAMKSWIICSGLAVGYAGFNWAYYRRIELRIRKTILSTTFE